MFRLRGHFRKDFCYKLMRVVRLHARLSQRLADAQLIGSGLCLAQDKSTEGEQTDIDLFVENLFLVALHGINLSWLGGFLLGKSARSGNSLISRLVSKRHAIGKGVYFWAFWYFLPLEYCQTR